MRGLLGFALFAFICFVAIAGIRVDVGHGQMVFELNGFTTSSKGTK